MGMKYLMMVVMIVDTPARMNALLANLEFVLNAILWDGYQIIKGVNLCVEIILLWDLRIVMMGIMIDLMDVTHAISLVRNHVQDV